VVRYIKFVLSTITFLLWDAALSHAQRLMACDGWMVGCVLLFAAMVLCMYFTFAWHLSQMCRVVDSTGSAGLVAADRYPLLAACVHGLWCIAALLSGTNCALQYGCNVLYDCHVAHCQQGKGH